MEMHSQGQRRRFFTLSHAQVSDIILAAGRKSPEKDKATDEKNSATQQILRLLPDLEKLGIRPSHYPQMTDGDCTRALKAVKRFIRVLESPRTVTAYEDEMVKEFQDLLVSCRRFESLVLSRAHVAAKTLKFERQLLEIAGGSRLEIFIRYELTFAYESIFHEPARVARPTNKGGRPDSPFVRFADAFFKAIGHPVALETIARALWPRN